MDPNTTHDELPPQRTYNVAPYEFGSLLRSHLPPKPLTLLSRRAMAGLRKSPQKRLPSLPMSSFQLSSCTTAQQFESRESAQLKMERHTLMCTISKVKENLYLGARSVLLKDDNEPMCSEHTPKTFGAVLNVTCEDNTITHVGQRQSGDCDYRSVKVDCCAKRMSVAINDTEQETRLLAALSSAVTFIEENLSEGRAVYVHCHAGVSRSPAVVAAYLMAKCDMSLYEALEHLRKIRPCTNIKLNFIGQLIKFQMPLGIDIFPA